MSTNKRIDLLCILAALLALALTIGCLGLSTPAKAVTMGYEARLFDTSTVHTIDIVIDDWQGFLDTCESEEYTICDLVIDGEAVQNVGIRGKGNTSLSSVSSMDSDRYSFKVEFDQYTDGGNYYGLDKLSLNNLIYDNTMMKDYLVYQMMLEFGAAAPLCSFVYLTVNGEDFGLYLAAEGVEDSFLERNYGTDHGVVYKPDSMNFGGGRGNGKDFRMDDFMPQDAESSPAMPQTSEGFDPFSMQPGGFDPSAMIQEDFDPSAMNFEGFDSSTTTPEGFDPASAAPGGFDPMGGGFGGMGSSDVKLQYIDDDPGSYSSIFDSAKTPVTDADKQRLIQALKALSEQADIETAVDVDAALRYFVVHNYAVNGDSYTGSMVHNYYLYEQNGRLSMLPWDYNLAFGTFHGNQATSSVNDPIDTPLSTGTSDRPMIDWLLENEEYRNQYHTYFSQFLNTVDIQAIIDQAYALISPFVEKDPTKFCTYEEFQSGVEALKTFCSLRSESILGQLDGTIPSTADGQQADSSGLIDASNLNISSMGSMSGGMGGMGPGRDSFAAPTVQETASLPASSEPAADQMQRPERFSANNRQATDSTWPLLGLCVVILAAGLIFALCYKRKG